MVRAFVAIGSNLDPAVRMLQAARTLKQHFPGARFSRCYRNPPFGFEGADFYNAVVGFDATLPIASLLPLLREIEARCGRRRSDPKWEPRKMDLDLLLYGDVVEAGPGYTLPRRDLTRRIYMLGPLAELAPDCSYPPAGPTIAELWRGFPRAGQVFEPLELDLNAA
ncbi:MAG TPA: 2-amino-4-hydroxy-6-hydroxymethyldihydropteridine diphosphokinase [Steroidobacteraceae bacterium]|jgi:2-amino-4-hydroxy-6-hydroxymethyldihydropteridine diphosphokinase